MAQDSNRLPEGAGAVGSSNLDRESYRPSGPETVSASYSASTAQTRSSTGGSARDYDREHAHEGRAVMIAEARKPSTATIVGAALVGAVAGAALPFMLSGRSSASSRNRRDEALVVESVIVNRQPRELYDFWRDFTNFPQFMDNIKSVQKLDDRRSHWVIKAPAGTSVEFDSYIVEDVPGRLIAWQSEEGASVPNRGRVEFFETSNGLGTNVRTTISYEPPAGAAGRVVAKLFQREPGAQARQDLQRFKQLMENR